MIRAETSSPWVVGGCQEQRECFQELRCDCSKSIAPVDTMYSVNYLRGSSSGDVCEVVARSKKLWWKVSNRRSICACGRCRAREGQANM